MRTKKAMYNIIASALYQVVSIVCGLITPRLILANFGSTYNGVIESATQFLSMVSILNIGIAGATRVALYKTFASNDELGTSRIMKATKRYMRKVAYVIVVYAIVLMIVYPLISHNDLSKTETAILIGIVSLSTFAEYFFGLSNKTLLSADQADYISSSLNIVAVITNTILTALLIKMSCSIFVVKFMTAMVFFISPLIMNFYVKHKYKLRSDCEPDESAIKNRSAVVFHSVANIIHNNTDILLLTIFTDAKTISVYAVYYLVAGKLKSFTQVLTNGIEAAFGNMWAKGEINGLRRVFKSYELAMYAFAKIAFTCMGILIIPFVRLYTKGVNDVNYIIPSLALLITVTEAVFCIRQPYLILVQAAGFYKETKTGALVEAVVNLVSSVILIQFIGVHGVIIGTLLANSIRTGQYIYFTSKWILDRPISYTLKRICLSLINMLIDVGIGMFILKIPYDGWSGWIVKAIVVFAATTITVFSFSFIFYKDDLIFLLTRLKGVVFKRK